MSVRKVGTVEILRERVYPLDPESPLGGTEAVVPVGEYPIYRDGEILFFLYEGVLNSGGRSPRRVGEGLFVLKGVDELTEVPVRFPSRRYDERMWKELMEHPVFQEDHPDQRIRIKLEET